MKTIFHNGRIHTLDIDMPFAEALVCENGIVQAIGTLDEMRAFCKNGAEMYDLQGAAVYPGFVDTHLHILSLAVSSENIVLNDITDRDNVIKVVAERAASGNFTGRIIARGFNEDLWEDNRLPTRRELDALVPDIPVYLTRVCGHMSIVNSAAVKACGIDENTPVPVGGMMDIEKGIFAENALSLIDFDEPKKGMDECKRLLHKGMSMAADTGLTAIYSDDFGAGGFPAETVIAAYKQLENEGKMPVRVVQQCALPDADSFDGFITAGHTYGEGSDMYRIGPRKLYADGSLGARTAWLSEPYTGTDSCGVPIYTQSELNELACASHKKGMPFIVHAIGDAAVNSVVEAVRYARKNVPNTDHLRDGIVHCQITSADMLKSIASEKISVYAQPVFTEYDLHICSDRVGSERENTSYGWKTLYKSGVCISSGSDCPVEPLDPVKNIYCAVTRKDFNHFPDGGWTAHECLSADEAVRCHTVNAAFAADREERFGKLIPGYAADMSVFDKSFCEVEPDDILSVKPIMTVVAGCPRYISIDNKAR